MFQQLVRTLCFTPTAVVTLHFAGLDDHWAFPQFLNLRELNITLIYLRIYKSTEDIQPIFHDIFPSLASPVLERVRLVLMYAHSSSLSGQDMDLRDATMVADRAVHRTARRPRPSHLLLPSPHDGRAVQRQYRGADVCEGRDARALGLPARAVCAVVRARHCEPRMRCKRMA